MYVSKVYEMPVDSYGDVRTLVRGLPYQCPNDWEEVLDSLDEDSNLYLVKEPDNPKDELAIAAYLGDRRIGYVAADDNCKVWMFLTDEKTPCKLIQKYEASFKVSFDNPQKLYENMNFEEIYRDNEGWIEKNCLIMEVPFLSDKEDGAYDWYRDVIIIRDFEEFVPDFRRKLAAKMITFIARKNSQGNYRYYLPYINAAVAIVDDEMIKGFIDMDGFVIAIPDLSYKTYPGGIHVDLNVARLQPKNSLINKFRIIEEKGGKELVFYLNQNSVDDSTKTSSINSNKMDIDKKNRTKCIEIEYTPNFKSHSANELQVLLKIMEQLRDGLNVTCYALNEGGKFQVYIDDDSYFCDIIDIKAKILIKRVIEKEKILVGAICIGKNFASTHKLLIKLYYDYISGNHVDEDITQLWIRDLTAQLHIIVPQANYIGKESKADKLEKESVDIGFPCYVDDDFDSFDFVKTNFTHKESNDEIIRITDKHQEDLYHNAPFVVLARQNPALPALYELCLPDGSMFDIIGDEDPEDIKLREWISEIGIVPVTIQSYEKSISNLLELHYRAFKRKSKNQKLKDFVSAHFIDDIVDIELENDVFEKIVDVIDPKFDGSMTENLNVLARIPKWASQAAYYIVDEDGPIWLAPSYHPDILDQVHQNNGTQGRVVSYQDNYDGTYHFELKFHIEK